MGSDTYHEALELLSEPTKDMHRAIVSLCEELEAIDWYAQRAEATKDASLKTVLLHNKNEEIEHAMMNLEWIRRASPDFDKNIRTYLLTTAPITEIEKDETHEASAGSKNGSTTEGSLGIGSLKE
jgi:ferritin-like protein